MRRFSQYWQTKIRQLAAQGSHQSFAKTYWSAIGSVGFFDTSITEATTPSKCHSQKYIEFNALHQTPNPRAQILHMA